MPLPSWSLCCFWHLPPLFHFLLTDCLHGLLPVPLLLSYSVFVFSFSLFFSIRYASPCLMNQLSSSICQPHSGTSFSISDTLIFSPITSSFFDSSLCLSRTPYPGLKLTCFTNPTACSFISLSIARTVSSELLGVCF